MNILLQRRPKLRKPSGYKKIIYGFWLGGPIDYIRKKKYD